MPAPAKKRASLLARIAVALVVAAGVAGVAAVWALHAFGEIVAGYAAKIECSCVFVAGREPASCLAEDLADYRRFLRDRVDREARAVATTAFGIAHARAEFDDAMGCTLR